jgi:hypothetical protein
MNSPVRTSIGEQLLCSYVHPYRILHIHQSVSLECSRLVRKVCFLGIDGKVEFSLVDRNCGKHRKISWDVEMDYYLLMASI